MKKIRFLGIQIDFHLSIKRHKQIIVPIPDDADDAHLRQGRIGKFGTPDGKTKVAYYDHKKGDMVFIDIPDCKQAVQVYVTPLYKKDRTGYSTDRKVIADLYW